MTHNIVLWFFRYKFFVRGNLYTITDIKDIKVNSLKQVITVSLTKELIQELDVERKQVPRSCYIETILSNRQK